MRASLVYGLVSDKVALPLRTRLMIANRDNGADDGDDQTQIQAGYPVAAEEIEEDAADKSADDADDNVFPGAHFLIVPCDFTGDPSRKRADDNPTDDAHKAYLSFKRLRKRLSRQNIRSMGILAAVSADKSITVQAAVCR